MELNYFESMYYKSAREMGLNPKVNKGFPGFHIYLDGKYHYFYYAHAPINSYPSTYINSNKYFMNQLLKAQGIPVPEAILLLANEEENNLRKIESLKFPVVAKPNRNASSGKGVFCNIPSKEALKNYLKEGFEKYNSICIESYKPNLRPYRVLVLNKKVIGVVERIPAHVVGDGVSTIKELIEAKNKYHEKLSKQYLMSPLAVDYETYEIFKKRNIDFDTVPPKHENIPIRYTSNNAVGGSSLSYDTSVICRENAEVAIKATKALGLKYGGVDFICEDITVPFSQSQGYVLEVNPNPGIGVHEDAQKGPPARVSMEVIKYQIKKSLFKSIFRYIKLFMGLTLLGGSIYLAAKFAGLI